MDTTIPMHAPAPREREVAPLVALKPTPQPAPSRTSEPALSGMQVVQRSPGSTAVATVLLVDDDEIDVRATRRAFTTLRITNPLVTARDGIEALDLLRGNNGCTRLPPPYLILLDLHMPRMGGVEFLTELRNDPVLCQTVVFVMTNSAASADRMLAYQKNIAGYVLKEDLDRSFVNAVALLHHYWCMVQLPD
jgi:CheY-like chemotaxis protein